jgi:hypothetical protein
LVSVLNYSVLTQRVDLLQHARYAFAIGGMLCLSFLYLLVGFNQDPHGFTYDEGITVYGATNILNGELPYRDFWTIYAPGQFYLLAGLFKVTGASILAERVWSVLVNCLLGFVVYLTGRQFLRAPYALLAWGLVVIWLGSFRFYASPLPTALLFSLVSCFCLVNFLAGKGRRWLFLSGFFVGVAGLFRHDLGAYTLVAGLATTGLAHVTTPVRQRQRNFKKLTGLLPLSALFIGGATLVLAPVLVYFLSVTPPEELGYNLITFPLTIFPKYRSLPYPWPSLSLELVTHREISVLDYVKTTVRNLLFVWPLVIGAVTLILVIRHLGNRKEDITKSLSFWSMLLFALLSVMFLNQARVRSDVHHLLPVYLPALLLICLFLSHISQLGKFRPAAWLIAGLIGLAIIVDPLQAKVDRFTEAVRVSPVDVFDLERARGLAYPYKADYQAAIDYIRRTVEPDERIFVGNTRHDKIFSNDIMFYFLANRQSATKYYELHPGLVTTAPIQQAIINDLEQTGVKTIVLFHEAAPQEPNASSESSQVFLLDAFIQGRFSPVQQFGSYTVLERKPGYVSTERP